MSVSVSVSVRVGVRVEVGEGECEGVAHATQVHGGGLGRVGGLGLVRPEGLSQGDPVHCQPRDLLAEGDDGVCRRALLQVSERASEVVWGYDFFFF